MKQPNILIIVSDQQSIDTLSSLKTIFKDKAYGAHWLKTPNLDRMVEKGMCFTQSHSTNPVCSPARSSIFTGRMTIETGLVYNNIGIDRNVPNMGQWFSENSNYERWYCGKWHAGGKWNYPALDGPRKIPGFSTLPGSSLGTGDIADYEVSAAGAAFIENYREEHPFLLVLGFMNPHDICFWNNSTQVPDENQFSVPEDELPDLPPNQHTNFKEPFRLGRKKFDDAAWKNYRYDYFRMIEKLDADIGRVMDAVDARDENTLVILTADHGDGAGRHSLVQKWFPYEEALKVPFLVYAPEMIQQGIDTEHLVSGVDIMSTVCDYAGIPAPPDQRGRSLRPLLEGGKGVRWRDHVYAEFRTTGRIIRTKRYKFVKFYETSSLPATEDKHFVLKATGEPSAFIPGKGHLFKDKKPRLLFDMEKDPWETENLATNPDHQEIVAQHEALLKEWEARLVPGIHYDRN
jgi:arylsulfatase A-like enzyme